MSPGLIESSVAELSMREPESDALSLEKLKALAEDGRTPGIQFAARCALAGLEAPLGTINRRKSCPIVEELLTLLIVSQADHQSRQP